MGFNYKSLDKNTIQVTIDDKNFYIENCTSSADMLYWLNQQLTAAQTEIAKLQAALDVAVEFINSISIRELDSQNVLKRISALDKIKQIKG